MAKDIVCGKELDEQSAITTGYGDRPYYFCSKKCEDDFVGNPIRYVNPSGAVASTEGSPKLTERGERISSKV
jgi:YHS domain-containing protein